MKKNKLLGSALALTLAATAAANALTAPEVIDESTIFGVEEVSSPSVLVSHGHGEDHKCGEGKCGEDHKCGEGKCGEDHSCGEHH